MWSGTQAASGALARAEARVVPRGVAPPLRECGAHKDFSSKEPQRITALPPGADRPRRSQIFAAFCAAAASTAARAA